MANFRKIAVVTGANKGLGLEIAKQLCEHSCHVILACRNFEHAGIALETFKNLGYDAEFRLLDISSKESIHRFAEELEKHHGRIDILVNTASITFKPHDPTPFEEQARPTVLTNYFGTLWLIEAMLPLLRKSTQPRVVNIASETGHLRMLKSKELRDAFSSPDLTIPELNALMDSYVEAVESGRHVQQGWPSNIYGTSKLGVIAMTQVLARDNPGILVNSCCPGFGVKETSTHISTRSIEMSAHTPVYLALLPEKGITGKFLSDENDITASW